VSRIKFKNCIVCEHVVPGLGGKTTLINIYSENIRPSAYPAQVWIAFYLERILENGRAPEMTLTLEMDGRMAAQIRIEEADSPGSEIGAVIVPDGLLRVERPSRCKLIASVEGYKNTTALDFEFLEAG
jgi:hypothetical protein